MHSFFENENLFFLFRCVICSCTRLLAIWRKVNLLHLVYLQVAMIYEISPQLHFHLLSRDRWLTWTLFFISALYVLNVSRLFCMLRHFPIESKGRRKKLHEVWALSSQCVYLILCHCANQIPPQTYNKMHRHLLFHLLFCSKHITKMHCHLNITCIYITRDVHYRSDLLQPSVSPAF